MGSTALPHWCFLLRGAGCAQDWCPDCLICGHFLRIVVGHAFLVTSYCTCVCVWLCISPYKHDMMLGSWYRSCPLEVIFIMHLWLHGSYKHDSHTDLMECTERDKMSFYWVWSSSGRLLHTQCEIATMFGNVGNHLPVHTTRHPRKRLFSNMAGRTWNRSDIRAFDVKIC